MYFDRCTDINAARHPPACSHYGAPSRFKPSHHANSRARHRSFVGLGDAKLKPNRIFNIYEKIQNTVKIGYQMVMELTSPKYHVNPFLSNKIICPLCSQKTNGEANVKNLP